MNRQRCAGPHPEHRDVSCELVSDHAGSHYHYSHTYVLTSWRDASPTAAVPEPLTLAAEVAPEIIAPAQLATAPEAPASAALPAARHSAEGDPPAVSASSILAGWGRTAS